MGRVRLPPPPAVFVGRDGELTRLVTGLQRVAIALVYGVAGVGKSALACRYAASWRGPVAYCRIGTQASVAVACEDALRQLAVRERDVVTLGGEPLPAIANALDERGALWVIDDLHHLAPDDRTELVRELGSLRTAKVIATSRELLPFEADAPDRFEVRLGGLDEGSAHALWAALDELHGSAPGFDGMWSRARGNPLRLRQAHACRPDADDPVIAALRALSEPARRIATALALSECPLRAEVLQRLGGATTSLAELVTRMIVDPAGPNTWQLHDLFREALATEVPADVQRALRVELADALQAEVDPVLRTREVVRHLTVLGHHDKLTTFMLDVEPTLIRDGAAAELVRGFEAIPTEQRSAHVTLALARARARQLDLVRAQRELAPLATADNAPAEAVLLFAQIGLVRGDVAAAHELLSRLGERDALPPLTKTLQTISLAVVETHRGDGERGRARIAAAEASANDADEAGMLVLIRGFLVWLDELDEQLEPLLRPNEWFAGSVAAMRANVVSPGLAAVLSARLGRIDEAEAHYTRAAEALSHDEDLLSRLTLAFSRAVLDFERGERSAAERRFRELAELCRHRGYVLGALLADAAHVRVLFTLGRVHEATELGESAAVRCERHGLVALRRHLQRAHQFDVVTQLGETRTAHPTTARALAAVRAAAAGEPAPDPSVGAGDGFVVERALTTIARAVVSRLAGDETAAVQELAHARDSLAGERGDPDLVDRVLDAIGRVRAITPTTRRMLTTATATALVDASQGSVADARSCELRTAGTTVSLRTKPQLARLLFLLASRPNTVVSKDEIVAALWGGVFDPLVHDNTLKVTVTRLRAVLGDDLTLEFDSDGYRLNIPGPFLYLDVPASNRM